MPWNSLSRLSDRKDLRRPGACRKPRPVRPRLEPLEERLTPSGNGIVEYTIPPAYYGPFGLVTASGNLYFTERGGSSPRIGEVTTAGAFTEFAASPYEDPYYIAQGPSGNLWYTEAYAGPGGSRNDVGVITTGGAITNYAPSPAVYGVLGGISAGPDGNMWFMQIINGGGYPLAQAVKVSPSGAFTAYTVPTAPGLPSFAGDVTAGPDGNLWFTEPNAGKIGRVTPNGTFTEYSLSNTSQPYWITAADGALWFTEAGANKIGRITTAGVVTEFAIPTANSTPHQIVADSSGNLWFTESASSKIGRLTPAGVFSEYTTPTANSDPEAITLGPDGHIWFSELNGNKIGAFDWPLGGGAVTVDPLQGLWEQVPGQPGSKYAPATGTLHVEVPLDFMQTSSTCGCGASALAYNSDSVDVRPVIDVSFASDPADPVPTLLQARLVWSGGAPGPWVTISTAGHNPGDAYSFALEETTPVTVTGVYGWEVDVQATLPGNVVIDRDVEGYTPVVANDASPIGAGWSVGKVDSLVIVPAAHNVPAGILYVYGYGQSRFFQAQGSGYLSPPNDFGTLTRSGSNYVYTDTSHLFHTFNSAGQLISLSNAAGLTNTYSYTGSLLTGITMYDGGHTAFIYSGGLLSEVDEPGGRRVLVTHTGTDLTGVTNADGGLRTMTYDATHHLATDPWGVNSAAYGYDAATGVLVSITLGNGQTLAVSPAFVRELQTGSALGASPADTRSPTVWAASRRWCWTAWAGC